MAALAMCFFGMFVGYVVTMALRGIRDWGDGVKIAAGLVSVIGAGGGLTLVHLIATDAPGSVYYYPVGLCYTALTTNSAWMVDEKVKDHKYFWMKVAYCGGPFLATILLLGLLLVEPLRNILPK